MSNSPIIILYRRLHQHSFTSEGELHIKSNEYFLWTTKGWLALNKDDIDSAVDDWNKLFTHVADSHAPIRKSRIKGVRSPWMNARLSEAMHKRDHYHRKALKSKSGNHWSRYKELRNYVNKEIKRCKSEYYSKLITENKSNASALWKTLNDTTSRKERTPISCIEADCVQYCSNKSIAKILNDHFSTIGTKLAQKLNSYRSYIFSTPTVNSSLPYEFTFEPIMEDFILRQPQQLKTNKAIGLDNFSARLLKDSATIISASLTRLFNLSLETHIFPSLWKFGKVTELFKKGDRCDANNYRPITVLPTICKILEKAVHIQLYAYLKNNEIITSKQFGFRPKLSTGTTLAYFTDNILQNMEAGSFAGAVFLDLSLIQWIITCYYES